MKSKIPLIAIPTLSDFDNIKLAIWQDRSEDFIGEFNGDQVRAAEALIVVLNSDGCDDAVTVSHALVAQAVAKM